MRPTLSLQINKDHDTPDTPGIRGRCFVHELSTYLAACAKDPRVVDLQVWYPSGEVQLFPFTLNTQEPRMDWSTAIVRTLEAAAYFCVVGLGFRFFWIAWQERKVRR